MDKWATIINITVTVKLRVVGHHVLLDQCYT